MLAFSNDYYGIIFRATQSVELFCAYNGFIKTVQITALKNYPNISNANQMSVISIMNDALPKKNTEAKVSFSEKKLDKYFPSHYSAKDRETVIIQLLEQWSEAQKAIQ